MTEHTFRKCAVPECNRRVMAHLGNEHCLLHRGRPKYPKRKKTAESRAKERVKEKRAKDSAGVPWL